MVGVQLSHHVPIPMINLFVLVSLQPSDSRLEYKLYAFSCVTRVFRKSKLGIGARPGPHDSMYPS